MRTRWLKSRIGAERSSCKEKLRLRYDDGSSEAFEFSRRQVLGERRFGVSKSSTGDREVATITSRSNLLLARSFSLDPLCDSQVQDTPQIAYLFYL